MLVGERGQNLIIMTCRKTQLSPHYLEMYHYQIIGEIVEKLGILFHTFSCEKHLETKSFIKYLSYLKKKLQNFPAKKLTLQQFFFFSWMWWTLLRKRLMFVSGGMLTSKCKRSLLHDANFHKSRQKLELV